MTERTDHSFQARRLLAFIDSTAMTSDHAAVMVASAAVHAQLALVEQQRIANRIAIASLRLDPNGWPELRHLAVRARGKDDVEPVPEISAALGLEETP